ncbi:hypothetical protein, partial [Dokdonella fugitiva]|uniref:hypothetical protein n=1 Tax=Dokdonella fugitiva TaxID=328517 RepID=UPI001C727945
RENQYKKPPKLGIALQPRSSDDGIDGLFRDSLKSILRFLHESFVIAKKFNDQTKMARIRIDHLEVCGLLHLLDEAPDDYADPDSLLDRVSV